MKPSEPKAPRRSGWKLFRRRECLVPTWRGLLVLLFIFVGIVYAGLRLVHPFLAVNAPVPGGALIVEGWAPDDALHAAIAEYNRHPYEKVFVTGGPLERGAPLSEYHSYAELGAATLIRFGLSSNVVQAVPAPWVTKDRTFASAISLRKWWTEHSPPPKQVNLVTIGPHARRSRLLFQKALGEGVEVGVTAIPIEDYDAKRWWRSSQGFRAVTGEIVAYGYVRIFFRAPKEKPPAP